MDRAGQGMEARRFSIFVMVGAVCALLDIGLMQGLMAIGVYYLAATTLAFAVGVVANFFLHTHVTFDKAYSHTALVRFLGVVLVNYLLTLLVVASFQAGWHMPMLGKLASLPLVAINGFLLSRYWVYR